MSRNPLSPGFPALVQDFFCQRLISERNASGRTVASYRDAFRLLFRYAELRLHKPPVDLSLADLDAPLLLGFLDHLEQERGNCIRSRNTRLAAVRSFLQYASYREPAALPTIQRVLAIPFKRFEQPLLGFLSRDEMEAILQAPDRRTWSGRRDHVMLTTFYNTGARISEIIGLRTAHVLLDPSASVHIHGKGRKQRTTPLWPSTAKLLKDWFARDNAGPDKPVFPSRNGQPLSRSGVERRLQAAVALAQKRCPTLEGRRISPHTLRHTTAMHLLQSGVELTVISLWLGHEDLTTTHRYIEADLRMKERALGCLQEPPTANVRYRVSDRLLAFLESL